MRYRLAKGTPRALLVLWLLPLAVRGTRARVLTGLLAAGGTLFFRDPERTPAGPGPVAAADGVVQWVRTDDRGRQTVSTYLNLLDVHVTRSPCEATVVEQTYRRGRHRPAFSLDADLNERMEWRLVTEYGELLLVQYAGTIARRIVTHKSSGDRLHRSEPIGLIRFGSRVDLVLPPGLRSTVCEGQRLRGGTSVVAMRVRA